MKKTGKRIIGIVVLLLIVVLLQGSMVSTYNDEYKLILQFGKVVRVVETPGLSFKIPFLQTTQSIPNYEMIYDLIPSEVNTRDKKVMVTDSFALWSVTDPLAYLSRLGANKANAESRISVVVYNAVKNVISSTDQADVISGRDGKLAEMITEKIGSSLDSYGIKQHPAAERSGMRMILSDGRWKMVTGMSWDFEKARRIRCKISAFIALMM